MVTHGIAEGKKNLHVSISEKASTTLNKNVTKRKQGEAIESLILEKYPEEKPC